MTKHFFLVAGEASGDQHAAKLIGEIKQHDTNVRFSGIGGVAMQNAGVDILANLARYGVVGGTEVLMHLRVIIRTYRAAKNLLRTDPPDLLILVNYPSFNLRLAKFARKLGIKTLFYISPQVWAWKRWRIKTIRKTIDLMAVILPFEAAIYQQENVPVKYVGHPLTKQVKPSMSVAQAKQFFQLRPDDKVIGLLPGSRTGELKRLLPIICAAAAQLKQHHPECQFILPVASSLTPENIHEYLPQDMHEQVKIVQGHTYDVMHCCDAIIITSGTATLETALIGTPMVIIYKFSALSFAIAKRLIKVDYIGLCNLLARKAIVPELIQHQVTVERIVTEINKYLDDKAYAQKVRQQLQGVRDILATNEEEGNLAKLAVEMAQ
ncbi:MAG: lipid-A-disaccharide synthase [Gammaproteobacteria bacterium]